MTGPEDLCLGKNSLMFIGETGGLDTLLNHGSAAAGINIQHVIFNFSKEYENQRYTSLPTIYYNLLVFVFSSLN